MIKLSKRMSLVLRHDPGRAGLVLDAAGWVPVDELISALGMRRDQFDAVVVGNDKRRFAVERGADGVERVRASQGHTVPVDLGLEPVVPPDRLFHGTSARAVGSIRAAGLNRARRHHVHLSADVRTARVVGSRRGDDVAILVVDAAAMSRDGYAFFRSANGVWLTDRVPAEYLSPAPGQ